MNFPGIAATLRNWLQRINPAGRVQPADPAKELRFTRAAQAEHFAVVAVVAGAAWLAMWAMASWPWHADGKPLLGSWWWSASALVVLLASLWAVVYCAHHAYVILSPVGVEIFPLIAPSKHFRLVPWQQIRGVRHDRHRVWLEFGETPGAGGVVLSLRPLRRYQRELLVQVLESRCSGTP